MKVYVPCDAAALAMGADAVARAIKSQVGGRRIDAVVVRNGSRGLFWLEPMVEVETPEGRVAYGTVSVEAVESLFEAGFVEGQTHRLCLGPTEEIPYLKQQERLTFARCGKTMLLAHRPQTMSELLWRRFNAPVSIPRVPTCARRAFRHRNLAQSCDGPLQAADFG